MDNTDKRILKILSENSNETATEISRAVNLSVPAVNKRILKLQNDKIIKSFTVLTDAQKVNKPIIAFIFIVMQYGSGVEALLKYIGGEADILECYAVTGEYDYLIKLCSKDIESLEAKLLHLKNQKGVIRSHTMLSSMEHKLCPTVLPEME